MVFLRFWNKKIWTNFKAKNKRLPSKNFSKGEEQILFEQNKHVDYRKVSFFQFLFPYVPVEKQNN